jgi:hypothetical protein
MAIERDRACDERCDPVALCVLFDLGVKADPELIGNISFKCLINM